MPLHYLHSSTHISINLLNNQVLVGGIGKEVLFTGLHYFKVADFTTILFTGEETKVQKEYIFHMACTRRQTFCDCDTAVFSYLFPHLFKPLSWIKKLIMYMF